MLKREDICPQCVWSFLFIKASKHMSILKHFLQLGWYFLCSIVCGYLLLSLLYFSCSDLLIAQVSHFPGQFRKLLLFLGPLSAEQFLFRLLKKCKMMMQTCQILLQRKWNKENRNGEKKAHGFWVNWCVAISELLTTQIASWRSEVTMGRKCHQFYWSSTSIFFF